MMIAKAQGKDIHACTNSHTDSLLEVDWSDTWWNDNQGCQVIKQGRADTIRCHEQMDGYRHTRECGTCNGQKALL